MNARLIIRMTAPTVAISLLLLAVGVGAAWHVHTMQRRVATTLQVNVASMCAAEELEIAVREARTRVHHFLLTGDRRHLERVWLMRPEIDRWLAEAVRWATTKHEQRLMARVRSGLAGFYAELDREEGADFNSRLRRLSENVLADEILEPTHEYLDFNEKEVETTSQQNRTQAGHLIIGLLLLGVCGSAAGLVTGVGFARAVSRSLVQLSVPVRDACGQLEEVVGPVTFSAADCRDLSELEGALCAISQRIGSVVERLRQSEREALRAEQLAAVGQMAAGMAHELRNPLTAMKILVQAAHSGTRQDGLNGRDLAVLQEEITRLERVIQTFLHFARPPRPETQPVELGPLIESTAALVEARAELCGVAIRCELPDEPAESIGDPGQLRQVLLNLLLNAVEAMPGGGEVLVTLSRPADDVVELRVRDSGPGLPTELGERIFSPFVSTKETGLGLGLSICRRIVEEHGGLIEAQDEPGGGATFVVRLLALSEDEGANDA